MQASVGTCADLLNLSGSVCVQALALGPSLPTPAARFALERPSVDVLLALSSPTAASSPLPTTSIARLLVVTEFAVCVDALSSVVCAVAAEKPDVLSVPLETLQLSAAVTAVKFDSCAVSVCGRSVIRLVARFCLVSLLTCTMTPGRNGQRGGDFGACAACRTRRLGERVGVVTIVGVCVGADMGLGVILAGGLGGGDLGGNFGPGNCGNSCAAKLGIRQPVVTCCGQTAASAGATTPICGAFD